MRRRRRLDIGRPLAAVRTRHEKIFCSAGDIFGRLCIQYYNLRTGDPCAPRRVMVNPGSDVHLMTCRVPMFMRQVNRGDWAVITSGLDEE